jgi:hypothetical protein
MSVVVADGHHHVRAATILHASDQKRYLAACRQSPYRALRLGGSFSAGKAYGRDVDGR